MRDKGGKGKMMFSLSFIALGFHKKSHPGRNQGEDMRKCFALPHKTILPVLAECCQKLTPALLNAS